MRVQRPAMLVMSAVFALAAVTMARADGEAGLVIQHGDGSIDTYCIPFSGDSITGKALLQRVNIPAEDYGGLVCAVGQNPAEGCFGANSFDSCTCKCAGGSSCTYWAYFTASYGKSWVYSALGYTQQRARDGDLQAWRWGPGGPNSAPAPPAITFESVCGHPPRGGAAQPATQAATSIPTATASPDQQAVPTAAETATAALPSTSAATPAATAPPSVAPTVTVSITSHGTATATPAPQLSSSSDGGSGARGLLAFIAVAAVLVAAIGGALIWRRGHGG